MENILVIMFAATGTLSAIMLVALAWHNKAMKRHEQAMRESSESSAATISRMEELFYNIKQI